MIDKALELFKRFSKSVTDKWNPERQFPVFMTEGQLRDIIFIMRKYMDMADLVPPRFHVLLATMETYLRHNKEKKNG